VRLAKDQPERFESALTSLASNERGAWLANAFGAYRLPETSPAKNSGAIASSTSLIPEPVRALSEPDKPLLKLASLAPDSSFKRAYALGSAVRDLRQGSRASAIQELELLANADPSDAL